MEKHLFNKTILREYDIRGIVGKDLHFQDLYYRNLCIENLYQKG